MDEVIEKYMKEGLVWLPEQEIGYFPVEGAVYNDKYFDESDRELLVRAYGGDDLIETLIIHRIGEIKIADPIVLVCVWSAHRAEAFDACRFIMEDLKSKAPFWKQETTTDGKRWIEKNTPG